MSLHFNAGRVGLAAAASIALAIPSIAGGHAVDHNSPGTDLAPYTTSGKGEYRTAASGDSTTFSAQHGGTDQHLPATKKNVKLLSEFEPTTPFGPVVAGQIADLSIYKTTAYLNSWSEATCTRGGVYTVNISNPTAPTQTGFIPALAGNYHGEGAHVISIDERRFRGDLLAVNNEFCTDTPASGGGFDLYDVTNPAAPEILVQGAGDRGGEGQLTGPDDGIVNDYHSVFMWEAGKKVYLVGVDNIEFHDVDIFDITDPRNPQAVAEHDLLELFPSIEDESANGNNIFFHDMVVKEIGGRQVMSASYWDAGYVLLDVTNPSKPVLIRDSSFDGPDPLTGDVTAEGNAHESEFSHDNKFLLAADEDFAPYRPKQFEVTTGAHAGQYPAAEVGGGASQASLPDQTLNGPVVYGGYGCPGASRIPARSDALPADLPAGEEAIVVLQRGPVGDTDDGDAACFPGEKAAEAKNAGYDAVILINRHLGSAGLDEPYCGSGGYPDGVTMVTLCVSHAAGHALFNDDAEFTTPYDDETEMAVIGTVGEKVSATSEFDGWGYGQLYRNGGTKMERVDSFAVPEALDPAYAFGFGDLSIHEFATDPDRNLAYSAYYAAGLRVFKFGESGIEEVGRFIDEEGNNFWGIEQFTTANGKRLVAASDRDHGLFLFEYTGKR